METKKQLHGLAADHQNENDFVNMLLKQNKKNGT
jgi:hypothetical protein